MTPRLLPTLYYMDRGPYFKTRQRTRPIRHMKDRQTFNRPFIIRNEKISQSCFELPNHGKAAGNSGQADMGGYGISASLPSHGMGLHGGAESPTFYEMICVFSGMSQETVNPMVRCSCRTSHTRISLVDQRFRSRARNIMNIIIK